MSSLHDYSEVLEDVNSSEYANTHGPINNLAPETGAGACLTNSSSCFANLSGFAEYHEPACEANLVTIAVSGSNSQK
jgi:hypothetical protein